MKTILWNQMVALLMAVGCHGAAAQEELPVLRPDVTNGFSNGGWCYDRYQDLPPLNAHAQITVADLKGPGVIRMIHVTRHHPKELMARAIVLEVWFDDAAEPAVQCPLADFFGDGCNGSSMYFSTPLIECAPWSYNCYIPMPFQSRARVILRNDSGTNAMDYSYVEWEPLAEWQGKLGYFHATYDRSCFQLTKDTDQTFFEIQGRGHIVGRQYSVVTDEPIFRGFNVVMEGNNEVDVDGRERALDYLGTEDSFGFSWGFQNTFAGQRAGMTLVETAELNRLSIYRFHDHLPIRFAKSLRWHINWSQERGFTGNPLWAEAVGRGGCWVDYATVHYWYQDVPGGYPHRPLPVVEDRQKMLLRSSLAAVDLGGVLEKLETDPQLDNSFASEGDLRRVHVTGAYVSTHPFWIDQPAAKGGHPGNPNPGKQGILAVHARNEQVPCTVIRKVALPADRKSTLRIVVSGDPYELPGQSDFLLQAGVHDGQEIRWFPEEVVDAGNPPSESNWKSLEYSLDEFAGKTVGLVVRISYGGPRSPGMNEEAFLDEMSVVSP